MERHCIPLLAGRQRGTVPRTTPIFSQTLSDAGVQAERSPSRLIEIWTAVSSSSKRLPIVQIRTIWAASWAAPAAGEQTVVVQTSYGLVPIGWVQSALRVLDDAPNQRDGAPERSNMFKNP